MRRYAIPRAISFSEGRYITLMHHISVHMAAVFTLIVIALAIEVMIGDGCCAFVSLRFGKQKSEDAKRSIGNVEFLAIVYGLALCIIRFAFAD